MLNYGFQVRLISRGRRVRVFFERATEEDKSSSFSNRRSSVHSLQTNVLSNPVWPSSINRGRSLLFRVTNCGPGRPQRPAASTSLQNKGGCFLEKSTRATPRVPLQACGFDGQVYARFSILHIRASGTLPSFWCCSGAPPLSHPLAYFALHVFRVSVVGSSDCHSKNRTVKSAPALANYRVRRTRKSMVTSGVWEITLLRDGWISKAPASSSVDGACKRRVRMICKGTS